MKESHTENKGLERRDREIQDTCGSQSQLKEQGLKTPKGPFTCSGTQISVFLTNVQSNADGNQVSEAPTVANKTANQARPSTTCMVAMS